MVVRNMLFGLIKKRKVLFFSMILVTALAICFGVTFLSTLNDYQKYSEQYINNYGIPDVTLELSGYVEAEDIKKPLSNIIGIEKYETSAQIMTQTKVNDRAIQLLIRSYDSDSFIKFYTEGEPNFNEDLVNVSINKQFATANKLKVGSNFVLSSELEKYDLIANVSSIYLTPELTTYSLAHKIPVDNYDYGIVCISKTEIDRLIDKYVEQPLPFPASTITNRIIIKTVEGADHGAIRDKATKAINSAIKKYGYKVSYNETKEGNASYRELHNNYTQLHIVCEVVPSVFVFIAFILIFMLLFQIIRGMLKEFGIMNALGINKRSILLLVICFSLLMTLISIAVGVALSVGATIGFYALCQNLFYIPIGFGFLSLQPILLFSGIVIAISLLASCATMLVIRKISPKDAMTNNASKYKPLPKPIVKITEKGSINTKLTINSIHKNVQRFIISITTAVLVYAITFASFNYHFVIDRAIKETYSFTNYDVDVYGLTENVTDLDMQSDIMEFESVSYSEPHIVSHATAIFNTKKEGTDIYGFIPDHKFIPLFDKDGNECPLVDDEVVIEQKFADKLGVVVGDTIYLNGYIKVSGIYKLSTIKAAFMTRSTLEKLLKKNKNMEKAYCVFANLTDTSKENQFLNELSFGLEYQTHAVFSEKFLESNFALFQAVQIASIVCIVFSLLIGLIVFLIMNQGSFNDQMRMFSILCTVGFDSRDVSKLFLNQNILSSILGFAIGIPIGIPLAKYVISLSDSLTMSLSFSHIWWIYLVSISFILIFIIISQIYVNHKIKKMDIVTNLKTRE